MSSSTSRSSLSLSRNSTAVSKGRPAIHPEVLVRALLISSLYNITSFRRLCSAISENIALRWFCFLTIDDKVFDHSTISYFIERVGNEGFGEIFQLFYEELLGAAVAEDVRRLQPGQGERQRA